MHPDGLMGTDSQKYGGKAVLPQTFQGQLRSESNPGSDFYPVSENIIDFIVQYLRRQTVVWNPYPQHTARYIKGLENGDPVAF